MQMLLAVTRPRLPHRSSLLARAPAVSDLRPRWAATDSRGQLSVAARVLALAQSEPPGLLFIATRASAACQAMATRLGWLQGTPAEAWEVAAGPMLCLACTWPNLLLKAGAMCDRLASLEVVVGELETHLLGDPRAAALLAAPGQPPGLLAERVRAAVCAGGRVLRAVAEKLDRGATSVDAACAACGSRLTSNTKASGEDPTTHVSGGSSALLREVKVEGPGAGSEGGRGREGCAEACDALMNKAR